ncbi:MAG: exonuclease subunit SbcD [Bacteroidaceae bacterium]|nr:exonuclease subunit SbcD [Bacteroidaceae bacterium]
MKIITTSDWHLGNLFHGNDRLAEHKHFLSWLLSVIDEHQPDALLVAGDVFDNGNPSAAAQSAYYEFLAEAGQTCPDMQIIITAGNHDSAHRLEAPRAMLAKHHVEVRGSIHRLWNADNAGGRWKTDYDDLMLRVRARSGDECVVLAVPYLRSDVVQDVTYSQGVNLFLRTLTERAREKFPGLPLVMMAHMYAKGADIALTDASEKIVIGGQEEVNMEGWTDHPDYLTCGHIHKRQHIWNTDWARYSGSVLPMSFAEKDYEHGVDLVTIGTGKPKVEKLFYIPQHRLIVIPEDDAGLTPSKLEKLICQTLSDRPDGQLDEHFDYVVLRVRQEKVNNDQIKQLEDLVNSKNAVLCKIQKILPQTDITTIVGARRLQSIDDILNRNPMETIQEAYTIRHGVPMEPEQQTMLADLLAGLNNQSED